MKSLRISGLYNKETLKTLFSQNILSLGFDQRPLSFNFIQGYVVEECLLDDNEDFKYYFHFANEKDFVINLFLEKMKQVVSRRDALYLEFSDEMPAEYYESFKTPYLWHFKKSYDYKKILTSKELSTLSLDNEFLIELERQGELFKFLNEIFELCKTHNKKIELSLNWNSDVSSSLLDFYTFDSIHFSINSLVETSYRHMNLNLLSSSIAHTKSVLEI